MSGSPSRDAPAPPTDLRGIIDPAAMQRLVTLHRYPAGEVLDGVVDWFWAVSWRLPSGAQHVQPVLSHPGANISIGTVDDVGACPERPQGRVYGLQRGVSQRRLVGDGWTVAAKTTVGGFGALITGPAQALTDRRTTLDEALGLDGADLVARVTALTTEPERIDLLRTALEQVLHRRDPARLAQARRLAQAARLAEQDPAVTRPEHLAAATGVSLRTLQRLFGEYVGAGPAWVIRRWRVIEAADRARARHPGPLRPSPTEAVRDEPGPVARVSGRGAPDGTGDPTGPHSTAPGWPGGPGRPAGPAGAAPVTWAGIAAELGYSDQAHLVREFRAVLGTTPAAYAARQPG